MRESYARTYSSKSPVMKARLVAWHREPTVMRVDGPTNLPRAHALGYKATKQYIVVRVRISKGKRARRKADLGRKPGKNRKEVNPGRPLDYYAAGKAARKFTNLQVAGAYFVGQSGTEKYFEVIMRNMQSGKPREFIRLKNNETQAQQSIEKAAPKP